MKRKMLAAFLAATTEETLPAHPRALLEQHQQHRHLARQMLP
mgnify:CR=1 FL=1